MKYSLLILLVASAQLHASEPKVVSLTLESGEEISTQMDIKEIFKNADNKIDMLELRNGKIFYDTEIMSATIIRDNSILRTSPDNLVISNAGLSVLNDMRVMARDAGDGSGGG